MNDHIVDRICRIADAMLGLSARSIRQTWGLRPVDLKLLNILDGEPPLPVREIGRRAHVDQAWVSRTVRDLEARGLVRRRDDQADSRLSLVSLTAKGVRTLDKVRPYAFKSEQYLLRDINGEQLKALLDRLEENVGGMIRDYDPDPKRK